MIHSILAAALIAPQAAWAGKSCKAIVAADPSKGVHLVIGANDADLIFSAARSKFLNEMGDGEDFENVFERLADGKKPKHPKQTLDDLKDFRKLGLRLRSEFVLLDEGHEVPDAFENFIKKLGHLNDALEFNAWGKAEKEAKKTLKAYRVTKIVAKLNAFKAAKPESIVQEINDLKIDILALISKPHSTVIEFHDTRKDLKHLLSIVQAFNDQNPTPEFANAFEFLDSINETLGDMRQGVLEEEMTSNKSQDHDEDIQDLPESVKASVKIFLANLNAELAAS